MRNQNERSKIEPFDKVEKMDKDEFLGKLNKVKRELFKRKLIKNVCKCAKCGDIIDGSHGFVYCKCGSIGADGGLSYVSRLGEPENIIEMSEWEQS